MNMVNSLIHVRHYWIDYNAELKCASTFSSNIVFDALCVKYMSSSASSE